MTRKNISSGSKIEDIAKYSRAVVDGEWVFVSGTVGSDPSTGLIPEGAQAQTMMIFQIIKTALKEANADFTDIVRTRIYVTSQEYINDVILVLAGIFEDIRPANTTIICQLPVPEAKVEIEVTARLPGSK
jgi:enamine deaminase RidA (YjgF/YER057c/UK114 family)